MKTSPEAEVRALYEESAEGYATMMDAEISLPVYADILGRLAKRIEAVSGPVIDTSCGSGHMLSEYHERYDSGRALLGIDLSPRMVAISQSKLGSAATVIEGDMRDLSSVESDSATAVLSFFAIHHLDPEAIAAVFAEWKRVLRSEGQFVVAAWEGTGTIDYGNSAEVVANRYRSDEIHEWATAAGFRVDRCVVESVEGMDMSAVYLEATKASP